MVLDRLDIPRRRWRDVRTSNEWEAFYAAVWTGTMRSVADAAGTSVSRVARALGDRSPFSARHVW